MFLRVEMYETQVVMISTSLVLIVKFQSSHTIFLHLFLLYSRLVNDNELSSHYIKSKLSSGIQRRVIAWRNIVFVDCTRKLEVENREVNNAEHIIFARQRISI